MPNRGFHTLWMNWVSFSTVITTYIERGMRRRKWMLCNVWRQADAALREQMTMPGNISGYDRDIYHLLCRALGQCVAVTKVVDFNVLDVVAVRDVNVTIKSRRREGPGGGRFCGGSLAQRGQ